MVENQPVKMIACNNCGTETEESTSLCNVCMYPVKGTDQEQTAFIAKQIMLKSDVEYSIKSLKFSQNTLYILAIFYLTVPNLALISNGFSADIAFNIVLALILGFFGWTVFKKPKLSLSIPLAIMLLYYALLYSIDPMYLLQGMYWKVAVLVGLSYGLTKAFQSDKILRQNPYLASQLGYNKLSQRKG